MRPLISLSLFLVSLIGFSQQTDFQDLLDSLRRKSDYPGIVYAVVKADGTQSTFASGWADVENEVEMTSQHKLHSGSTGKTVVSALVMQLMEEGKIAADDPVKKYLGTYDWYDRLANSDSITIRNLLQHSSGIIRYEFKDAFLSDLLKDPNKIWEPEELIAYVLDDEPPFAAGQGFTYADTNYILLGMIIEKITGRTFYDLADEKVLKPLDIKTFTPTNTNKIDGLAQGYYTEGSEYALGFKAPFLKDGVTQNNMQFEWTGGGYCYATSDYALLLKKLYEGEAFDLDVVGEELFNFIEAREVGGEYGSGVMRYKFPGLGEFIGHAGFFPGYNSLGLYHQESKMAFAMQINSTNIDQLRSFFGDFIALTRVAIKNQ